MRCIDDKDIIILVLVILVWLLSTCAACYLFYNHGKYNAYKKINCELKERKNKNVTGIKTREKVIPQVSTADISNKISYINTYATVAEDLYEVLPSAPTKDVIYDLPQIELGGNIYEDLSR